MAEVTLRWPTVRSNPLFPEHEERTYSSAVAAAEAIIEMGHDVWVRGIRVTPADARQELDIRAQAKADREAAWAAREAEAKPEHDRLTRARREAVTVELTRGTYGIGTAEQARQFLGRFPILELVAYERADRIIAAYEGVS